MENDDLKTMHARLTHSIHRIQRVNLASVMEVSQGEFFALQMIELYQRRYPEEEGIYVSNLAKNLRIAPSQASRMLRSLEERELIGRSVDTRDRRNTYVFLTENGKEINHHAQERMRSYFEGVWSTMGEERIDELIQLCNELADVMESELKRWKDANSQPQKD